MMGYFSEVNGEEMDNPFQAEDAATTSSQEKKSDDAPRQDAGEKPAPQTDDQADTQDEDARRKAHEESEAKRKAEWDARQAAKKAAEQEQLDKIASMSEDELMTAAMQRVSADTEKLTRRNMKECVSEFIQTKCLEDPAFAQLAMHPRKSMVRCFQYISRKAWEYIQDEMKANGITPGRGQDGYGCDIPDDLCYQWAEDYFRDPDVKEDHADEEKFEPKPYISRGTKSRAKSKAPAKPPAEKKSVEKPKANADDSQISFLEAAS